MPSRPITALAATLALVVAAPAAAQDPPDDAPAAVERIYEDYRGDGKIDVCDHEVDDLQKALDTIEPDFDRDYPDFRAALEAGINDHFNDGCADADPTPTPTATASPDATADPTVAPESGDIPPTDDGAGGTGAVPPEDGTLPPEDGATAPEAAAPVPAPTTAPPAAATTPAAGATPVVVTRSGTDSLLIPGILIGVALLGMAALAAFALAARRSPRLHHAWQEAAFRTRGTWADFSDWLRLGR